jgi:hypothetical protein
MKQGWNGSNHNDRFCYRRFYSLWLGHGCYWLTFILDKKMNAYELAEYLQAYVNEITDYDKDYHLHAAKVLILQMEEVKALRKQLIAATNELMEVRR